MQRRHARGGAAPPGLVDGRQDQHRLRHHVQQGPRADRGGPAVRPAGGRRSSVLIHPQSVVHGMVYYSDGSVLAQLGSPTCASRSPTPWPGPSGWPRPRPGSTWRPWPGWSSRARHGALSGPAPGAGRLAGGRRRAHHPQCGERGRGGGLPDAGAAASSPSPAIVEDVLDRLGSRAGRHAGRRHGAGSRRPAYRGGAGCRTKRPPGRLRNENELFT